MSSKLVSLVALALCACAGESLPPTAEYEAAEVDPAAPGLGGGTDRAAALPEAPLRSFFGFARHESGAVAVFERASGKIVAEHSVGGDIADIAWDVASSRAYVVTHDFDQETATLHAFSFEDGVLELVRSAEPMTGVGRVWPWQGGALLVTVEMSAVWTLFDSELHAAKLGKSLFQPAGLVEAADGAWIGLDANGFENGIDHDVIVRATHDGAWNLETWSFPAHGRPSSRFATGTDPDTVWMVRKRDDITRYEIAEIDALDPSAPKCFSLRNVPTEPGSLEGVVREPKQEMLVATLSHQLSGGLGELVLLPLDESAQGKAIPLGAPLEASSFPVRHLAFDPTTEWVLVATDTGLLAYAASGSASAPDLTPASTFSGSSLRAPFVLASP